MPYTPTKAERETIIRYDDSDPMATIYTHDRSLMSRMVTLAQKDTSVSEISRDDFSRTYKCPKKYVTVKMPIVRSEETRAKAAARLAAAREKKKEDSTSDQ